MARKTIRDGAQWGDWKLAADTLHLVLVEGARELYAIPLVEMTDSVRTLDWIFQVRAKTWATNDIMGDLLTAIDDLIDPQATLCSGGLSKQLDAQKRVSKLLGISQSSRN